MTEIIIHVGLHKTASSSIQASLYENRELLDDLYQVYYPTFGTFSYINHSVPIYALFSENPSNHHILKSLFHGKNKNEFESYRTRLKHEFCAELSNNTSKKIVISGEDLSILNKHELCEMKKFFMEYVPDAKFSVCAYVRDPIHWSVSNSLEILKHGYASLSELYYASYKQNLAGIVDNVTYSFGRALNIFSFDDIVSNKKDIVSEFLDYLGIDPSSIDLKRVNEGMSLEKALALNLCKIWDTDKKAQYIEELNELIPNKGSRFSFSQQYQQRIWDEAIRDREVANLYGIEFITGAPPFLSLNKRLLRSNIAKVVDYLTKIYRRDFNLSWAFRDLATDVKPLDCQLSSILLIEAYNVSNGPLITQMLNSSLETGSVNGFFYKNKFIQILEPLKQKEPISFSDNFDSFVNSPDDYLKKVLPIDATKIYQESKEIWPSLKLLASILNDGYLTFPSPFSNKNLKSSTTLAPNLFLFEDDEKLFYVSFWSEQNILSSLSLVNIVIPSENLIVHLDYDPNSNCYGAPITVKGLIPTLWEFVCSTPVETVVTYPKKTYISTKSLFHIGHSLWNCLSVYDNLLDLSECKNRNHNFAFCDNFYFTARDTAQFFDLEKDSNIYFETDQDLFEYCQKDFSLPVFFSNSFITQKLSSEILDFYSKNESSEIDLYQKRIILLSLRSGSRECLNVVDLYADFIETLDDFEDTIFIIDGVNNLTRLKSITGSASSAAVSRISTTMADEIAQANAIISKVKRTNATVMSIVGSDLGKSLFWASQSELVVSPWGAGLVKYKWLLDCNTFIYGSKSAMSANHLHKFIYDKKNKERLEESHSEYFNYSDYSNLENRNTDYTIDSTQFNEQLLNFYKKSIEVC